MTSSLTNLWNLAKFPIHFYTDRQSPLTTLIYLDTYKKSFEIIVPLLRHKPQLG